MLMPAAVLWDLDGTLIDSEPLWLAAEHDLAVELGGTWTQADAAKLVGSDLRAAGAALQRHFATEMPVDDIVDFLVTRVAAGLANVTPWRPGARELLDAYASLGVPQALVTMSYASIADPLAALLPFGAVITGDRVTRGKPHPEPYQKAAAELGVDPRLCLAVEDSPTGAASANAAGCRVLAVPHVVAVEPHPGRYVVPTLAGISPADVSTLLA